MYLMSNKQMWLQWSHTLLGWTGTANPPTSHTNPTKDTNLSFESHVSSICKTAFFHLKNISKLRHMLSLTNIRHLNIA